MATSMVDGTIEEVALKRRRSAASFYDSIKFRTEEGTVRTLSKAHAVNAVADLLVPGTRGRFYIFTAIDHKGVHGIRTVDGRAAQGVARINERVGLGMSIVMGLLLILQIAVLGHVQVLTVIFAVLGLPLFFVYRQNRVEAERQFAADAAYRPPSAPAA